MSTANVHMPRGRRLPRLSDSEELPVYQPPRRKVYDVYEEDQSERESASASATPEGPEEDDQGYAQGEDEQGNYIIGSWRMGLFRSLGAAVFPNCFMSLVVPCVPLAQAVARIGWLNYWLALLLAMIFGLGWLALEGTAFYHLDSTFESTSYQSYYVDVDISPISTIFARNNFSYGAEAMLVVFLFGISLVRRETRRIFLISGSWFRDLLVSCLCPCCAVAQLGVHLDVFESNRCTFGPVDKLPAYFK